MRDIENEMVIGDYFPDPPAPEIDRELQHAIEREEREPITWKESSVRMCMDCGETDRIRDGVHEGCTGRGGPGDYLKAKETERDR